MRKKGTFWGGIALALALVVAGSAYAATATSHKKAVLNMSVGAEPPSLDPGLATDTTSAFILNQLMDPLIRLGPPPALKPEPGLVQSWQVKGTDVTLHLRHDDKWTNGKPVTANDVVQSWLRTISPELAADYAYQFYGIVGAQAYNSCDTSKQDCNALRAKVGVSAPDKWTVKVKLVSPQPWFIQQLSHTSFLPVYLPAVQKYGNKWTEPGNIVTDGPFKLAAWKHDAKLTLVKNPQWRDAKNVKLDVVNMPIITDASTALNAYKAGSIDVDTTGFNPTDIPKLKKMPDWHVYKALGTYYYGFNVKAIPDVNQRKAMAAAIDRHAIVKYITQSGQVPAKAFTPIGISGGDLIDKNGWLPQGGVDTPAGLKLAKSYMAKVANPVKDINLYINNSPGHIQIAQAIQSFWQKLGITVNIKVQEWKQYLQFLGPPPNSSVGAYRLGWIADYPDAYNFLSLWTCDSGNNNTNWCNKKYDALMNKAIHTQDAEKRTKIYQQAEDLLTGKNGDMPIAPIYWYTYTALVRPKVKGFFITPMDNVFLDKVSISS
ncbi:MAG: peptide ABC transporter substrate-binding protein [Thermoleophilaceae bacterium]|nr:peptide ABC transporter substrate-binding protein [Thermoleophilaceae bacterium]